MDKYEAWGLETVASEKTFSNVYLKFLLISIYHPYWFSKGETYNSEELKIMVLLSNCVFCVFYSQFFKYWFLKGENINWIKLGQGKQFRILFSVVGLQCIIYSKIFTINSKL